MSSSKNVDLKCSETLRDSPPPIPLPQLPPSSSNVSVFASNIVTASPQNLPSHQHVSANAAAFTPFLSQQPAATVSLFVKKFDTQHRQGVDSVGRNLSSDSSGSSGKIGSINAPTSSLPFGIGNVVSASKLSSNPQQFSLPSQQQATAYSASPQSTHVFSGFPISSASIWPLIQQHAAPLPQHIPITSKQGNIGSSVVLPSPTKLQQGATSATLPLSPSKALTTGGTHVRPLTLHVSTSRGPAVLQLQHATTASSSSASGKQPVKLLPASLASPLSNQQQSQPSTTIGLASPMRSILAPTTSVTGNIIPTRVPVLRPSPVHPMAAATAAILSQLAPNVPAFGLVDPHNHLQQQQLQAAAAMLRSPMTNTGSSGGQMGTGGVLPHVVAVTQQIPAQGSTAGGRTVIVSVSGSHFLAGTGSHTTVASGTTDTTPKKSIPTTPSHALGTPVTPSPTRPSILRKRTTELSNGGNSAVKRLAYEPVTLAKRTNEKGASTPDSDSRPGTSMTSTVIEHPEAGNSNQSSSASTISAGSTADNGNGHSLNSSQATITGVGSPSPRKRPRKQQLNELTSTRGYGSDDDVTTPVVSYHCEPIEEETVVGPTGIGNLDVKYLPSATQRMIGQAFLPTMHLDQAMGVGESYDYHEGQKKHSAKSQRGHVASQRHSQHYDRPSTSFDQLQQQIEQQRKHVPEYRPRPSLLAQYELAYDSKRFHFSLEDEVKAKEEKRATMIEMSNQKQIWQRIGGWKTHLMSFQFDNLDRDEKTNFDDLNELYELLNEETAEDEEEERKDVELLKEMVLTNLQRVKVIREHLDDGKKQLMTILKHKTNVEKLIQKFTSKRPMRKKDRGKNGAVIME